MKIERPKHVRMNIEHKTSELYFPDGSNGEFYMRGGISFPVFDDEDQKGYALMIGYHVQERKCYVFEETEWTNIEHIFDDHELKFPGISPWFGEVWQSYFADSFFYNDRDETERKYLFQILRSPMIKPKPYMIPIKWNDDKVALNTIWEWGNTGRFQMKPGKLADDMAGYSKDEDEIPRSMWSLMCAMNGIERYPYRHRN